MISGDTVTVRGGDSRAPSVPFTFEWGDGTRSETFFDAKHTYADTSRNYRVTVTAHYGSFEQSDSIPVTFRRVQPRFTRDPDIPARVTVAREAVALGSTMPGYAPPSDLVGIADRDLAAPRALIEYVLDIAHAIETDLCNGDIDWSGGRGQLVLCQPGFGGAFSLWFTKPIALGANPSYLSDVGGLSSLFHEMGHNLTLNSPAAFRFGGKTDGPMNTIISENLAQVMQHATAWEILNKPGRYGLPEETCEGIRRSAICAFGITARAYLDYKKAGCPFATVQSGKPGDPDRTFGTFMTLACKFVEHAEAAGQFREPAKRLMRLLQTFREADHKRFVDPANEGFRATFSVAALSHAFAKDLRPEFRDLRFPIDDAVHAEMLGRMNK